MDIFKFVKKKESIEYYQNHKIAYLLGDEKDPSFKYWFTKKLDYKDNIIIALTDNKNLGIKYSTCNSSLNKYFYLSS